MRLIADAASNAAVITAAIVPLAGFGAADVTGANGEGVQTLAVLSTLPALTGARRVGRSHAGGRR